MKSFDKIDNFLKKELLDDLKNILVTKEGDTYKLFGLYKVYQNTNGYYQVNDVKNNSTPEFISIKNAIAWCTFEHVNRFVESRLIKKLDSKLASINIDIMIHKKNADNDKLDEETRWTQQVKLQEDLQKKRQVLRELNYLINTSKSVQVQKFNAKKKQTVFNRKR